jgi:DNA-binding transcriptional LysR family regulator
MTPDPAALLVFAEVVRAGSFTAAARALGSTKQAVSLKVARLEDALGVRLLERTTRSLRTTQAGHRYVERCRAIAAEIAAANQEAREAQLAPSGPLRVSAPFLYGRRFLSPLIARFLAAWPKVQVDLQLSDRRVDLVDEGFDLAVRVGELDAPGTVARRLGDAAVHWVVSPRLRRRLGAPTVARLADYPCIARTTSERWAIAGREVHLTPRLVVNDLELACDAAVAGLGVAQVPGFVTAEARRRGQLEVLFPQATTRVPLWVVLPGRRFVPPAVRHFVDVLLAARPHLDVTDAPTRVHRSR